MDRLSLNALQGAAGASGAGGTKYVEEVFSTDLYVGNSDGQGADAQDITNDIDLSPAHGGLVWLKRRDQGANTSWSHYLYDTERGATKSINSNGSFVEVESNNSLSEFLDNGFTLGETSGMNDNDSDYVSWTFRKAPGFFDVVTWVGNGTAGRQIAHNLGCKPGCIMVKCLTHGEHWSVYHKSTGATHALILDDDEEAADEIGIWNDTEPTDTHFTLGTSGRVNEAVAGDGSTRSYVAYLFADGDEADAQIWGDDEDEAIIKMGTYSSDGNASEIDVDCGFEPQYVMVKCSSHHGNWHVQDDLRGIGESASDNPYLQYNTVDEESEDGTAGGIVATPRGFTVELFGDGNLFNAVRTYIYIAIRRGPMKKPTDATKVFAIDHGNTATPPTANWVSNFVVDASLYCNPDDVNGVPTNLASRKSKAAYTETYDATSGEESDGSLTWDYMNGWGRDYNSSWLSYMFKRAPGFFDVAIWHGDGSQPQAVPHNLGVPPEFIIAKDRANNSNTICFHKALGTSKHLKLNSNADGSSVDNQYWYGADMATSMNKTHFNTHTAFSHTSNENIAYLFASLDGISHVGSYTGATTGESVEVNCEFSAGARFVLIKRTDDTGSWYLFDSERGIVTGSSDPYHFPNDDSQTIVTNEDRLDANNNGFTVRPFADAGNDMNYVGGNYIYLAIA